MFCSTRSRSAPALAAVREAAQHNGYTVAGFASTAQAAHQLREAASISADTLQAYWAMGTREQAQTKRDDPANRRLFRVDESSLASTQQMKEFLDRLGPHDLVLVIGDTRQHQAVDAGKPFGQLQDAGM
jgi:ATP-dependent exoDNAse (exonuclease V) alpha subunit